MKKDPYSELLFFSKIKNISGTYICGFKLISVLFLIISTKRKLYILIYNSKNNYLNMSSYLLEMILN